ncbi:hypothetical protein ACJX0J_020809, partial [Zea mays]
MKHNINKKIRAQITHFKTTKHYKQQLECHSKSKHSLKEQPTHYLAIDGMQKCVSIINFLENIKRTDILQCCCLHVKDVLDVDGVTRTTNMFLFGGIERAKKIAFDWKIVKLQEVILCRLQQLKLAQCHSLDIMPIGYPKPKMRAWGGKLSLVGTHFQRVYFPYLIEIQSLYDLASMF